MLAEVKNNTSSASLYDLNAVDISGNEIELSGFKGMVTLVVNTASRCGFTYQLKGLEKLYQKYKDRGFTVLAFPSNDFAGQEPGSNKAIKNFCESNYGVTFPIFEKGPVTGSSIQPVYRFLTSNNEEFSGEPGWNFVKFLVNKDGYVVGRFSAITDPLSSSITSAVDDLLK